MHKIKLDIYQLEQHNFNLFQKEYIKWCETQEPSLHLETRQIKRRLSNGFNIDKVSPSILNLVKGTKISISLKNVMISNYCKELICDELREILPILITCLLEEYERQMSEEYFKEQKQDKDYFIEAEDAYIMELGNQISKGMY